MITTNNEAPEREEIETMLPWFAAGTLNRRDAARVEAALAQDTELSRRFEAVRDELGETIRLNESLGAPSARALTRLFEKIDAEAPSVRRAPVSLNLSARISEFIAGFSPRTLAYAGSVAALAIVLQAGVITGVLLQDRAAPSGPGLASHHPAGEPGSFAVIRFAPQASVTDITRFLADNKVVIVDGPVTGGMYRVRLPAKSKDEAAAVLKKLAENKIVELSAPVQ
jgi:hypothetical protein